MRIVIAGRVIDIDTEDGGCAKIGHLDDELVTVFPDKREYLGEERHHLQGYNVTTDESFFVRLHSWNEISKQHPTMDALKGKRIRITIEVV